MNAPARRYENTTYRPYPGDNHLIVTFSMEEFKNEVKTLAEGRAIYEDIEMVHIRIPGDKQLTLDAPASSYCTMGDGSQVRYQDRFPEDYDRWKAGQGAAVIGTDLKHAPFLSKAEVSNLKAANVFTIEQLAEMGGAPLRSLGQSGRKWQQQALSFLAAASGTRDATAEAAKIAALQERIAQLEAANVGVAKPEVVDEEAARKIELKDEIERVTGRRPVGNPSVETLQRTLDEVTAKAAE